MNTDRKTGGGCTVSSYRHPLLEKLNSYLTCLQGLADAAAGRKVRWTPLAAAMAAVLMTLEASGSLAVSCQDALLCMRRDFAGRRRVGRTYNGLIKALERQAPVVLPRIKSDLRPKVLCAMNAVERTAGWILLAVDGSKEDLPRTQSHEREFGIGDNGACPQAFITAIVETHTGLLWEWRIDKANASERYHLLEMVQGLPQDALLLADGNFVGYPIWSALHQHHKDFLIRVGGNVHLLRDLWPQAHIQRRDDIVYVWPKKKQDQCAPLRLRLIRVGSRNNNIYLLTNVLDVQRLSRKAAGQIYRQRWGAELFYRAFKRTLGHAKLRSRAGRRGRIELQWALIAVNIMTLMGVSALRRRRKDPRRLSPAGLAHALRRSLLDARATFGPEDARRLDRTLGRSLRDAYQRHGSKASRHRKITRNTPKPLTLKPPKIRLATSAERQIAHERYPALAA